MPKTLTAALVAAAGALLAAAPVAEVGGAAAAPSPRPAMLAAAPPEVKLAAEPSEITAGHATTLTGSVTDPGTGAGMAGVPVALEALGGDGTWLHLADLTTDAAGGVTTEQVPASTTGYRLVHGVPGDAGEAASPIVQVRVLPLTALLSRDAVRVGRTVTVHGVLAADPGSRVRLEQRVAGGWQRVDRARTAADGSYAFRVQPATAGFWRWRVAGAGAVARTDRLDVFRMHTYSVETRGRIRADLAEFRAVVAATYADSRGWLRAHHRFREVERGGAFTVVLAQASHLPSFSGVCSSTYSCRVGRYVIINQDRWRHGSPYFPGDLLTYRRMVIDHETGHWLGRGHAYCPRQGARAPVMQQQSKGMQGCRVNPWPLPREIRAVT